MFNYQCYTETTTAWEAMLKSCEKAQSSIWIEQYVLEGKGKIGDRFLSLLTEKAKSGVEVKLLLDWWGSKEIYLSNWLMQARKTGVKIQFFRPPSQWGLRLKDFFPRDHRKLLIVDSQTSYIGGVCIFDRITDWRDTMLRIEGETSKELSTLFSKMWEKVESHETDMHVHPHEEAVKEATIYTNAPDSHEHFFRDKLIDKLKKAQHDIRITTPYFTPGKLILPILEDALEQDINIELMLSSQSKYTTLLAARHIVGDLIKKGAHVYFYQPRMLHAKTILIDKNWAAVGSHNLDGLSLYRNHEVMLSTNHQPLIDDLHSHFDHDILNSRPYKLYDWENRSFQEKLLGRLFAYYRKWL